MPLYRYKGLLKRLRLVRRVHDNTASLLVVAPCVRLPAWRLGGRPIFIPVAGLRYVVGFLDPRTGLV